MYTKQEIVNALNIIKNICKHNQECEECPFYAKVPDWDEDSCLIEHGAPAYWDIVEPEQEPTWRAFK
jgi:hypothetical protein